LTFPVLAQKQANFWYFGENAGLNFGLGVPVALTNGALNTGEGCSSISSAGGTLQCYTDGTFVYDRENNQMPHGNGLLGNYSSAQSGIIVPKPGSTTQFYIFTVDAYEDNLVDGLCYSRVDMTLNGGLGDVVTSEKNISLLPVTCEKVTAVGHSNGISIWVITHQWGTDAFYAYQITTSGVDLNPVISHAGDPLVGNMQQAKGYLKVSPDGTKIAMANNTAFTVGIFNFNHTSGAISLVATDHNFVNPGGQDPGGPYGVEFSPNSTRLYISEWKANRKIYQYDLTSNDPQTILNSRLTVASVGQNANAIGALQLGPDNRLYVARDGSSYLSRINSPNALGSSCGWVDNAVNLGGRISRYGLPPFIQSFFYLTADYYWNMPSCDGTPIQFFTSASDNPDSVKWDFGDPGSGPDNYSTLLNPTHLYPGTGNYWVTLVVYLYGAAKTVFHIVIVYDPPEVYLGQDTTLCYTTPYVLDAGPGAESYLWQNGETTQSIEATETGLYWCQVTGEGGCTDIDSVNLVLNPVPAVSAGPDKFIPNGT
ncbi:MAG TPA: PKD domain-containing protein, partial [Candidatus Paceibacterota bacterium]